MEGRDMATRTNIRDYYRKSIGFVSLINSLWLLCISGLAIYISDFGELSPESNSTISEMLLYGYYATFFVGAFMVLLLFVGGIVALKSQSEGIFKFLIMVSVVTLILAGLFTYSSAYTIWWSGVEWKDDYTMGILVISLVLGSITFVYSAFTIIMAILGRRYYDGRKNAKEAGNVNVDRLNVKFTGYTMITYILIALAVYAFSYYFKNEIITYDDIQGANNTKWINLFNRVFIAGIVMSIIHTVMTVCVFVKGTKQIMYANKIILMGQCAVTAFYIIVTIAIYNKSFTKINYPDPAYIIFSYILIGINLILAIRAFRTKVIE